MDVRHGLVVVVAIACAVTGLSRASAVDPLRRDTPRATLASSAGGDCNDLDAGIHPGAAEVAGNGIDDDCDGLADEDLANNPSPDISDADLDGFALANGDCNDHNDMIRPDAPEIGSNYVDDDCDGLADEDASGNPSLDTLDRDGDHVPIAPDSIFVDGFDPGAP